MSVKKNFYKLSFKITIMIVIMVVLCSVFVGVFVYRSFANDLYMLKGMTARAAADTLAATLDPKEIQLLDLTEEENDYYYQLKDVLGNAGRRTSFNFLYVLSLADNKTNFKVIYGQDAAGTFSLPLGYRDPIAIWNEASLRCFETKEHTYSQPYYAEGFGDLMSGYAPLLDSGGNVVAIVGLDIPLSDITAHMSAMRANITLIVAAFVILFSLISIIYTKLRLGTPITELSQLSENIVAGNLDYAVSIKSKDEIGVLAEDLLHVRTILSSLNSEISTLVKNAAEGQMQTRASTSNYSGDWGALLKELNHLLDTLNVPINYASKIQKNLLPKESVFREAFSDFSVKWSPRDIVGGDIYWMKNFAEGTILCVCDCTGHGTPGALLTMLVVAAFDTMVNETNYKDTAQIIWNLEQRLISVFNVKVNEQRGKKSVEIQQGCDLAVLYIAKDGSVTISSGNTPVFVCDGKEIQRIRGQRIFVGEGKIKNKDDISVTTVPANPNNKFYLASDGLYDQMGGERKPPLPFGYKAFQQIILENHNESQTVISDKIWAAFESYRGNQPRRDDFDLITFKP